MVVCLQLGKISKASVVTWKKCSKYCLLGFSQNMGTRLPFNPLALDPGNRRLLPRRHSSSVPHRDAITRVNITLVWLHWSGMPAILTHTYLKENRETGGLRHEGGRQRRRQGSVTWDLTTQVQLMAFDYKKACEVWFSGVHQSTRAVCGSI